MDHIAIIKQAFKTTISYRALWILGFLWALVGGGSGGGSSFGSPGRGNANWKPDQNPFTNFGFDPMAMLPWIILGCGLLLILGIAFTTLRYVLQAGIYRTLRRLSETGEPPSVRGAFRDGWHRRTWRLFLQDLVVGIPLVFGAILLLALAASPLLLLTAQAEWVKAIGVVSAVGLILAWVFLLVFVIMAIDILKQFWWRAAVLSDLPTFDAIRAGWRLVRGQLKDIIIMWLLMLGAGFLFAILMIPVVLVLGAITAAVAGLPGYMIYEATRNWLPTLIWAIPVVIILLVLPLTFIHGLYLIFKTEVWNQVFAEVSSKELNVASSD